MAGHRPRVAAVNDCRLTGRWWDSSVRTLSRRAGPLTSPRRCLLRHAPAWRSHGWPDPTIPSRIRVLRSAVGWAHAERNVDLHPLDGMRGSPQADVRIHAPVDQVRTILEVAQQQVTVATTRIESTATGDARLHRAEQVLLLTRLAADSGARRGELAALQLSVLDGDMLTIARATCSEVVGPTKSAESAGSPSALRRRSMTTLRDAMAASRQRRTAIRPLVVLSDTRSHDPADHVMPRTLVRRSLRRSRASRRDSASAETHRGHGPCLPRKHPASPIPPRAPRCGHHVADLQPRPAADRRHSRPPLPNLA